MLLSQSSSISFSSSSSVSPSSCFIIISITIIITIIINLPSISGKMTTPPRLLSVLRSDTPFPPPSNQIDRMGVRNTPMTLPKIALKIAVAISPPDASVCATQMLIVGGRQDNTSKPSLVKTIEGRVNSFHHHHHLYPRPHHYHHHLNAGSG